MTKAKLIAKQHLKIEKYEAMLRNNARVKESLIGSLYYIGGPLNDNVLKFNTDQIKWLASLEDKINKIITLNPE